MNKKKFIIILFLLVCLMFLIFSQTNKAPKIQCDEPTYDFGTISQINTIKHKFVIKNIGNDILKILNIKVTCGCTVTKIKEKNIKPGKQTDVLVELDLRGTDGEQLKEIIIESNDSDNKYYRLYLKGFTID